jgi:hypothetical protein
MDRGSVLDFDRVDEVWESNRADKPEAALGKELIVNIRADDEFGGQALGTLKTLRTGHRVLVEAFHFGGDNLTVVEQLKKLE